MKPTNSSEDFEFEEGDEIQVRYSKSAYSDSKKITGVVEEFNIHSIDGYETGRTVVFENGKGHRFYLTGAGRLSVETGDGFCKVLSWGVEVVDGGGV